MTSALSEIMSAGQEFALSAVAAGMSHIIHHPLYTLKSQMMYHGPEFRIKTFFSNVREQKSFLYRGLVSRTFGIMPEKAFKMQGWIMVGRLMERNFEEPGILKWMAAGAAAGAATTLIGCPSERAMVLAHIRKQAFTAVLRETGLRGLYFGFSATLYRDITFNMVFFTSREMFVKLYKRHYPGMDPDAKTRVLLGFPAGTLASVLACPFDVVKTRLQGMPLGGKVHSCSRIMLDIVRNEGARLLMKGLLPRLIAVPSMMSVFYVINEELERIFLGTNLV